MVIGMIIAFIQGEIDWIDVRDTVIMLGVVLGVPYVLTHF